MDITWVMPLHRGRRRHLERGQVLEVVRAGITDIIDTEIEFDDTRLAEPYRDQALWTRSSTTFIPSRQSCSSAESSSRWRRWMMPNRGYSFIVLPASIARP